jgi:hypothetical protein
MTIDTAKRVADKAKPVIDTATENLTHIPRRHAGVARGRLDRGNVDFGHN